MFNNLIFKIMTIIDEFECFSQSNNYIENSKPMRDCRFCRIHNYQNSTQQYAVCVCPNLCRGLVSVDISTRSYPMFSVYSCKNCNFYSSDLQLTLF